MAWIHFHGHAVITNSIAPLQEELFLFAEIRAFYWSCLCNFPSLLSFNIEVLLWIFLLHGHEMLVTVIHAYVNCATGYGVSRFASYMYLSKCIGILFQNKFENNILVCLIWVLFIFYRWLWRNSIQVFILWEDVENRCLGRWMEQQWKTE